MHGAAPQRALLARQACQTRSAPPPRLARARVLQFALLTKRANANMWRNPLILRGKIAQTLFLSLIVGLIYLQVGGRRGLLLAMSG